MKKILLIEDQPDKRDAIRSFLISNYTDIEITDRESLRGALREAEDNPGYDIVLLDMTMPDFDAGVDDIDMAPESYAGKEFLEQLDLRGIKMPVIVITQFSSFEGGAVTLESLSAEFSRKYPDTYLGAVYFDTSIETWKKTLGKLVGAVVCG